MPDIRTTGELADFTTGATENPISFGGTFAQLDTRWASLRNATGLKNIASTDFGAVYWTPEAFTGDIEIWGKASGGGGGAAGDGWRLGFFKDVGGSFATDGYQAFWFSTGSPIIVIRKYTNSDNVALATDGWTEGQGDGWWMFRKIGATLEWWYSHPDPDDWTLKLTTTDSTYENEALYLTLWCEDQSLSSLDAWDSFGGGAMRTQRAQIYRRVNN